MGLFSKIFGAFKRVDDEFFDDLEETLILADVGAATSCEIVNKLRGICKQEKLNDESAVTEALKGIITEILERGDRALKLDSKPSVVLMVGVNGTGKTTTLGKLSLMLKNQGKQTLLCAGDTFRAAAAEQLSIWAERAGTQMIKQGEGADAAAVVFDAISAAKARGVDVLLCDTAGRLHNKQNLLNELAKISRIIDRELSGHDRETLLVIDATTGQNGLEQARKFCEASALTGVVLTKLDGTAKGGIVVAVADTLGVPVKFIGVGERPEDLKPFDPRAFVDEIL